MKKERLILEEIKHLEHLRGTGKLNQDQLNRVCSAEDALRWALNERAILRPSELAILS